MVTMLYRFMRQAGLLTEQSGGDTDDVDSTGFSDADAFSIWAEAAIREMQATGLMIGSGDGRFRPQDVSTRAEAAKVMSVLLRYLVP
jgi:hypothetical protein